MTINPPQGKYLAKPLGRCPCGKKIWTLEQKYAVDHELPYCDKFRDLEVVEYLTYVRKSRGL